MVDAVIVSTARTPIGKAVRGAFNLTHGADMGGHVIAQAVKRAGIEPGDVEDVTMGCANPEGATGGNIARQCAIRAGLPVTAAGQTVNRFCSSGLQAIALAARSITQDGVPVAVAGGLESISLVQMNMNTKFYRNEWIVEHKGALYMPMIETADIVAKRYGISREKQDEYALMSQQRTAAGQKAGRFDAEIVPMTTVMAVENKETKEISKRTVTLERDEGNRPDTNMEGLAKLKPVRGDDQFITAGNASQLSDGASACVLMSDKEAAKRKHQAARHLPRLRRWRAASPTRWASARFTPCRGCCSAPASRWTTSACGSSTRRSPVQVHLLPRQARHPAGEAQRRRRRRLHRPPLRHERRAHDRPRPDRGQAPRRQVCRRHHVHRRRPGCCRPVRDRLRESRHGPSLQPRREQVPRGAAHLLPREGAGLDPQQGDGEPPPRQGGAGRSRTRSCTPRASTVPHWPKEWGGADWTPVQHYIYTEELQFNGVPQPLPFNVSMCGPVVIAFGTEEQKKRFLPRMAALDDWWCQGFSEPGAGSDLAGLKTTAVRQGDHYIVNGQKTWTTLAQYADWIFCLCRTDPDAKKQLGISFLLIDMKTPGITVRPIQTMDGGREVNEVFFDDVKVPVENLVGQEHRGWDCAKFLLGNERTGIARVGYSKQRVQRIKELAARVKAGDRPLIEDERFREKVAAVEVELKALEMTQMRVLSEDRNRKDRLPNPKSSILKIKGSEIQQATTAAAARDRRAAGAALPGRGRRRRVRLQRAAGRSRLGGTGGARLFQLPQGDDLRRLQRDPAQHPGQGRAGLLMQCVSGRCVSGQGEWQRQPPALSALPIPPSRPLTLTTGDDDRRRSREKQLPWISISTTSSAS